MRQKEASELELVLKFRSAGVSVLMQALLLSAERYRNVRVLGTVLLF
jgi:hypothetical protein